jgi:aerobic-type carbon monoxide dehydrogenase small subunit (CoxS/CutS family)
MSKPDQPAHGKSGFSRRAFLKGSGAAAAATAMTGAAAIEGEAAEAKLVAGKSTITLDVNGKPHKVEVEPRTTLLDALRYGLNLTGAKPISVDGSSGGSTVLIAGKPTSANTVLAIDCVGRPIVTVESLINGDKVDPIPMAFVHHDASQCGFCTPGFIIAVKAFLTKNPKATEAQIREGLNGNLCRCGTYANIIPAVLEVVKGGGNG